MGIFDYKRKQVENTDEIYDASEYIANDSNRELNKKQKISVDDKVINDKKVIKRNFIITKRQRPLKFTDVNLKSTEYELVKNEKQATVFDSMTAVMSMMDRLFKNGEKGFWYREVHIEEELEEHLYVFVLNSSVKKYIGFNTIRDTLFFTNSLKSAYKCTSLSDILEFGINYIPKDTLDSLQLVDLKENENYKLNRYLFLADESISLITEWEQLSDGEAFKRFSRIIEFEVENNEDSDIFKREVLKILGVRKYIIHSEEDSDKTFTKNALINLFSKMILIKASRENLLYIEWFIRSKLMLTDEVKWIVRTKWFSNTLDIIKRRYRD